MDEHLWDRVKELGEIEERLERICRMKPERMDEAMRLVCDLWDHLKTIKARAEQEYADF